MDYKYPPIYKYGLIMLLIFMYFKHQRIMSHDKILTNSIVITCFVAILDYILIRNHPTPLESKQNKESKESSEEKFSDDDIEDIINSYDEESENDQGDDREMFNPHVAPRVSSYEPRSDKRRNERQYYSTDNMY